MESMHATNDSMVMIVITGDTPFALTRLVSDMGCSPRGTNSYIEKSRRDKNIGMFALSSPCVRATNPTNKSSTGIYVERVLASLYLAGPW